MLRRLKNVLPLKVLMSLYHTLIASYINYGCLIWASNFQSNYRRVQVQQNKAIRILGNYDRGSASTVSIYKKFDILDVGKIRDMQIGILVYQCLHNLGPDIFNDFFSLGSSYHDYDTRNSNNLVHEFRNTSRSAHVIRYMGPSVWNPFPQQVKESESLPQLKRRLKAHLLNN